MESKNASDSSWHHPKQFLSVAERQRVEGQNAFPGNGEKRNNGAAQALRREHAASLSA
jgi:hypothetical protein